MLDSRLIRAEPARVRAGLARRGATPDALDRATDLDARWTARDALADALRLRRRRAAEEVRRAKTAGEPTGDLERLARQVAEELREVERDLARLRARRDRALGDLPNLPAPEVPEETAVLDAPPSTLRRGALAHWDLIRILDLARPAEASAGRGFLIWRDAGERLLRALEAFMLDLHAREFGYTPVRCPAVATRAALEGSAHLPALEAKMYALFESGAEAPGQPQSAVARARAKNVTGGSRRRLEEGAGLFLVPRAEPHLANLFRGQILEADAMPLRFVAAGPALRREADHGGAKGRGLLRLHEFPTVEVYAFSKPETGEAELDHAVDAATQVLARLGLAQRRLLRGARRLSLAAAKTIDLEVWAAGMGEWLGVAAVSTFTDYQSRRTRTRYRGADGKARLVHTVGGAAVALPHLVAALLENGQESDGSVRLPDALGPYLGGEGLLHPPKPPEASGTNG